MPERRRARSSFPLIGWTAVSPPTTTLFRDRNSIAQLRRIDSDESPDMLVDDSPSLFEALPGQSG
jgi:hypothetical protein